ncbi:hypothetical protein G9P44_005908 [Scheffersomyces stipitis]|nr:hypothetical protein G9P44_005908 [Scheffersomyces stipitis]
MSFDLSLLVGGFLIAYIVLKKVLFYWRKQSFVKKYGCKEPLHLKPPLFGIPNLLEIMKHKRNGDLTEFSDLTFDSVGTQTFTLTVMGETMFMTTDPENFKAMLATQFNDFSIGRRYQILSPVIGDSIFTLDGEGWKHSRAMLRPQFVREQVGHVQALEPHLQLLAKHIRSYKGETVDLQQLFTKFTLDTATEFLFGQSVHTLYDERIGMKTPDDVPYAKDFTDGLFVTQKYTSERGYAQQFYWLIDGKEFRTAIANVHKFARFYVDRALNFSQAELEKKSQESYTFLYELVQQTRDPKVLQDQLLAIMLAGRDTTSSLLSFIFYELSRNPGIWEKLKKEVYENFGSGTEKDIAKITFESLKKCNYVKWVINETLRMYPTVPVNLRVSNKDTSLPKGGGEDGKSPIFIPRGTTVGFRVYSTQRNKEYYGEDPDVFRPERWADIGKLGWAYLPFLGGPRTCIGQQFALTEAGYILVRIAQLFPNLKSKNSVHYPPKKTLNVIFNLFEGCLVEMGE